MWISEHYPLLLQALGGIWVVVTAIAAITPSDRDDTWIAKIGKWADRLGINIKGKM
jgi:hypothetical protein